MSITVEFKDFAEMIAFAKQLLGTPASKQEPKKKEAALPSETEASMMNSPESIDEAPFEGGTVMTYTLEEVRAKLAELTRAGKAKEVKELLNSFGAKNLTSLDPKHYAAVMEKAGAL